MADLAAVADVEAVWRPLTSDEALRAESLLRFASAVVRRHVPSVDDRITAATLDADLVSGVVATMVTRAMKNPDGLVARSVEDYTERYADARAGLSLTADELALLAPPTAARTSSVRLVAR